MKKDYNYNNSLLMTFSMHKYKEKIINASSGRKKETKETL